MSFKETIKTMRDLLTNITSDLEKAENGNKAASQRVRTGTVKLEKIAKRYRKESISTEKKTKGQKRPSKSAAGGSKSKSSSSSKGKSSSRGGKSQGSSKSSVKTKPKAKSSKASFRPRQLSIKRATAKLPTRRFSFR